MIEVELKAWLADYEATRAAVEREGVLARGETQKRDLYYGPEKKRGIEVDLEKDPVFRLREDGGKWIVTAKRREIEDGVESNDEVEFEVSDAAAFRDFAQRIGFRPFIVKRKSTRKYALGRLTIELNRVDPLGDFIELEILLEPDASREDRADAEREIRAFLARVGVPESKIEPRLYVDMLRKTGTGRPR